MKETIESFEKKGVLDIENVINVYNNYIYKILRNSISNETDLEEILSDVFVIFWLKHKELDKNTNVKSYLIGITKNLIKKKYQDYAKVFENIDDYENEIACNTDIQELVENNEKSKIVSEALLKMKDIDRDIFYLFYYHQMKVKEIAKTLNISDTNVKVILHRVRKKLKKILKERGFDYGK